MMDSNKKWKQNLMAIAHSRDKKSIEEILIEGYNLGLDKSLTERVVRFILDYIPDIDQFPIDFNDDVLMDYGIDAEDLGDFYRMTLNDLNSRVPSRHDQNGFLNEKVKDNRYTVKLIVEFLEWATYSSKMM